MEISTDKFCYDPSFTPPEGQKVGIENPASLREAYWERWGTEEGWRDEQIQRCDREYGRLFGRESWEQVVFKDGDNNYENRMSCREQIMCEKLETMEDPKPIEIGQTIKFRIKNEKLRRVVSPG